MKKTFKWVLIVLCLCACGFVIFALFWVRQYQALAEDEPEITLSPDVSDLVYCSPGDVALEMDLYFPANAPAPWKVLVYTHGGSFTGGDKRKGSGVIDIPAMTARGYAVAANGKDLAAKYYPENTNPAVYKESHTFETGGHVFFYCNLGEFNEKLAAFAAKVGGE